MPRTILEIAQSASAKVGIAVPNLLYGSTGREEVEIRSVLQEVADRIVRAHDWSALKLVNTYTGDGTTTAYALPSDYLRMPKDSQVWSTRWQRPLTATTPEDDLRFAIREYDLVVGTWVIVGEEMKFRPALADGELVKWYYISDTAVKPSTGANKATFTANTDTFRLGDRILELQFIWEWRQRKGLPYAEDMNTAEIALAQAISADGGAQILTQSSRRNIHGKTSYPWNIVP